MTDDHAPLVALVEKLDRTEGYCVVARRGHRIVARLIVRTKGQSLALARRIEAGDDPWAALAEVLGPMRPLDQDAGKAWGFMGGVARAKALTGEQRSEIAARAAAARWGKRAPASAAPRDRVKFKKPEEGE